MGMGLGRRFDGQSQRREQEGKRVILFIPFMKKNCRKNNFPRARKKLSLMCTEPEENNSYPFEEN